jgi:hypothetical protein
MKLLFCFKGKCINRFADFIDVIYSNRGNAFSVIFNVSEQEIRAIYAYKDEKQEDKSKNYYDYECKTIPYFVFYYRLDHTEKCPTYTKMIFERVDKHGNSIGEISVRILIEEFTKMWTFLKCKEATNFNIFYLKAKSIQDEKENKKRNIFYLQAEQFDVNRSIDVGIKTSKEPYDIIQPENPMDYFVSVTITLDGLIGVAEKWKSKLEFDGKDPEETYFCIRVKKDRSKEGCPLVVYFFYSMNTKFSFTYTKDWYQEDIGYKFDYEKFYMVKHSLFLNALSGYKDKIYKDFCKMVFLKGEILLQMYTIGTNTEEKEAKVCDEYSGYTIKIFTPLVNNPDTLRDILSK